MAEEAVTAAGGDPLVRGDPLARGRCPRCRKAIEWKGNLYRPFCSDRRWPFGQRHMAEEAVTAGGDPLVRGGPLASGSTRSIALPVKITRPKQMERVGDRRGESSLLFYPRSGFNAFSIVMFYLLHLGDEISPLDDLLGGMTSGEDQFHV